MQIENGRVSPPILMSLLVSLNVFILILTIPAYV